MKKKFIIVLALFFINISVTVNAENSNSDLINEQQQNFGISDFIKETENYSGNFFDDINISDMFNSAISGKIDNRYYRKENFKTFWK